MIEMSKYAIVKNNLVENICVWDGVTPWQPPAGTQAIAVPANEPVGPGYAYVNGKFIAPPPKPITAADNQLTANQILAATDWTSIPAVGDPAQSNPYLVNQTAWLYYRSQIRDISLAPPAGQITWPTPPKEQWSS